MSDPEAAAKGSEKDYFEPGVPPEMVRKSSRSVLGPHSISPTPPAVGYTSNNFSGTSSIVIKPMLLAEDSIQLNWTYNWTWSYILFHISTSICMKIQ